MPEDETVGERHFAAVENASAVVITRRLGPLVHNSTKTSFVCIFEDHMMSRIVGLQKVRLPILRALSRTWVAVGASKDLEKVTINLIPCHFATQ